MSEEVRVYYRAPVPRISLEEEAYRRFVATLPEPPCGPPPRYGSPSPSGRFWGNGILEDDYSENSDADTGARG